MKLRFLMGSALIAALAASCSSTRSSAPAKPVSEAEMMAKWTEFATPGAAHKVLDAKVGRWTFKIRQFMAPGAPPMESEGTSETKWIMDGRYLHDDTTSSMMGMPFKGMGITGYDNLKKKYVSTWIDNMGTGLSVGEGDWDAAKQTMTSVMEMSDPMAGKTSQMRAIERWTDADHFNVEMFGPGPDGKEMKQMELIYSRAK